MKKRNVFVLCLVLLWSGVLFSQTVKTNGYVRNSVYSYATQKGNGSTETKTHTRLYQTLNVNAALGQLPNIQLHFAGRALTDLAQTDLEDIKRFKAYRLSVSGKGLFHNFLDFELGRQFLYPGVLLGSLDGLNLILKPWKYLNWQIYGGVESHLLRAFKIYEPDEATVFGSRIKLNHLLNTNWHLIYLQKMYHSKTQWQIVGLNLANYSLPNLTVLLQSHYDLVNSRLHRLYLSARYRFNRKLMFSGYVKQQYPQVYNTSYFEIFEVEKYLLAGFNAAYQLSNRFNVTAMVQGVQLDEGYGNRFIVTLGDANGSLGLIYETGDLGNQLGLLMDYRYEILHNLMATISVDFSRYRFEKRFDYDSQIANALGLSYRFSRHWNARLEYQWLTNTNFKYDQRILNHINFIW
ncbi:hypothetical protein DRI50_10125 [candidate division KSB1 bacterium]|nr:MAG: hypothetical protein DRI50_10125 [candidate division KSB1 bacterium]